SSFDSRHPSYFLRHPETPQNSYASPQRNLGPSHFQYHPETPQNSYASPQRNTASSIDARHPFSSSLYHPETPQNSYASPQRERPKNFPPDFADRLDRLPEYNGYIPDSG